MKQITIYELLPLMCGGFVAMDKKGHWVWFAEEPELAYSWWKCAPSHIRCVELSNMFNIAPFDDDWKDSLMEVK